MHLDRLPAAQMRFKERHLDLNKEGICQRVDGSRNRMASMGHRELLLLSPLLREIYLDKDRQTDSQISQVVILTIAESVR